MIPNNPSKLEAATPVDLASPVQGAAEDERRRISAPLRKTHRGLERPQFDCVALVLQGGGALGAFQAGVYQALVEAGLQLDWVAGISIGAINAALIAGNAPQAQVDKLRAFWEQVSAPAVPDVFGIADFWLRGDMGRRFLNRMNAGTTLVEGVEGFFTPRLPPPYFHPPGT